MVRQAAFFKTLFFVVVPFLFPGQAVSFAALDPTETVKEGYSLTQSDADRLENALAKKPNDETARLKLLGYYATIPQSVAPETLRQRRAEHIFWLIEKNPRSPLFEYVGATWRIFLQGDALADPPAFERGKELWLGQIKAHPTDEKIKLYASTFLELGDPETATGLLRELKLNRAVGSLLAYQMLGVVAQDYKTGDPSGLDESKRDSEYGKRILGELQASSDPMLVGGAGFWLAVQGGMLYADGKITWDYTNLSQELLAKARGLDPGTLDWWAVSTKLPSRGERPPRVLRMGAAIKSSLRKSVTPEYPEIAKAKGVEGTVQLNVVIGLDGKILKAVVVSGPPELTQSALDAVSQWEYAPTLLNGKPAFIITKISAEYRLRGGVLI
jgi:TonB family protein